MQKLKTMIALLRDVAEGIFMSNPQPPTKESNPLILWESCDTLPVKVFYQILKTNELSHLGKASQKKLTEIWGEILDEYWELTNKSKYKSNIRKSRSLIAKQNKLTTLIAILTKADMGSVVKEHLNFWGLKTVKEARQQVLILRTQISLYIAKNAKDEVGQNDYNFYKDLATLTQVLNRDIDPDKVTVSYWIELNKIANKLNKAQNERNKKK